MNDLNYFLHPMSCLLSSWLTFKRNTWIPYNLWFCGWIESSIKIRNSRLVCAKWYGDWYRTKVVFLTFRTLTLRFCIVCLEAIKVVRNHPAYKTGHLFAFVSSRLQLVFGDLKTWRHEMMLTTLHATCSFLISTLHDTPPARLRDFVLITTVHNLIRMSKVLVLLDKIVC